MIEFPDAVLADADWCKQSWDLPPYKSPEFLEAFPDLAAFRKLPVYAHAVANGLIGGDEWIGPRIDKLGDALFRKYSEDQERDERGRWTAGGGGSEGFSLEDHQENINNYGKFKDAATCQKACDEIAAKLGYQGKIIATMDRHDFQLNGQKHYAAGAFYPGNKDIKIFVNDCRAKYIEGVLAHEVQHAKWDNVVRKMDAPTYARIGPLLDDKAVRDELRAKDGVSEYSKAYWEAEAKGERPFTLAANETLAEMAHNETRFGAGMTGRPTSFGAGRPADPVWQKLYTEVNKVYDERHGTPKPPVAPPKPPAEKPPVAPKPPAPPKPPEGEKKKLTPEERKQKRLEYRRNRLKNMPPDKKEARRQKRAAARKARQEKKKQEQQK